MSDKQSQVQQNQSNKLPNSDKQQERYMRIDFANNIAKVMHDMSLKIKKLQKENTELKAEHAKEQKNP